MASSYPQTPPKYKYFKTTDIRRGDLILQEDLWLWSFRSLAAAEKVCNCCFATLRGVNKLHRCPACRAAFYCSSACQQHDWKFRHKYECDIVKHLVKERYQNWISASEFKSGSSNTISNETTAVNAVLHMASVILTTAEKFENKTSDGKTKEKRVRLDLDEKPEVAPLLQKYGKMAICLMKQVAGNPSDFPTFSSRRVDPFFSSVQIDSPDKTLERRIKPALLALHYWPAGVQQPQAYAVIAVGLCLEMSRFRHSCLPNAVAIDDGKAVRLVALAKISTLSDVRLQRVAWANVGNMPFFQRFRLIRNLFDYNCQCTRCESENADTGDPVPLYQMRCPQAANNSDITVAVRPNVTTQTIASTNNDAEHTSNVPLNTCDHCIGVCVRGVTYAEIRPCDASERRRRADQLSSRAVCSSCGAMYSSSILENILDCIQKVWRLDSISLRDVSADDFERLFMIANSHLTNSVTHRHLQDKWLMQQTLEYISARPVFPLLISSESSAGSNYFEQYHNIPPRIHVWIKLLRQRLTQKSLILEDGESQTIVEVTNSVDESTLAETSHPSTNSNSREGSSASNSNSANNSEDVAVSSIVFVAGGNVELLTLRWLADLFIDLPYYTAALTCFKRNINDAHSGNSAAGQAIDSMQEICETLYNSTKSILRLILIAQNQIKPFESIDGVLPSLLVTSAQI